MRNGQAHINLSGLIVKAKDLQKQKRLGLIEFILCSFFSLCGRIPLILGPHYHRHHHYHLTVSAQNFAFDFFFKKKHFVA